MHLDEHNPTHRIGLAAAVAASIAFASWVLWMTAGIVLGAIGWLLNTVGGWLSTMSTSMTEGHMVILWIGLGCGAVVGGAIGFNWRVDRLWDRIGKKHRA